MSGKSGKQSTSRLIAVMLFVGLPALLIALAILNLLQFADDRFVAADKHMQLLAFNRRINTPAVDGKPRDLTPIYIGGFTRTLASANLQQYVVNAVSSSAGRLVETAPLDEISAGNPERADEIHLKATLDIDNNGLLELLLRLEGGLPLLDIESLAIRRLPEVSENDNTQVLRVDLTVVGKWRQPAS